MTPFQTSISSQAEKLERAVESGQVFRQDYPKFGGQPFTQIFTTTTWSKYKFYSSKSLLKGRQENAGQLGELKAEIQVKLKNATPYCFLPVSEGIAPEQPFLPSAAPCVRAPLSSRLAVEAEWHHGHQTSHITFNRLIFHGQSPIMPNLITLAGTRPISRSCNRRWKIRRGKQLSKWKLSEWKLCQRDRDAELRLGAGAEWGGGTINVLWNCVSWDHFFIEAHNNLQNYQNIFHFHSHL